MRQPRTAAPTLTGSPQPQDWTEKVTDERVGQLGQGGLALGSVWGPFVGKGQQTSHEPFYLDGYGHVADSLRQVSEQRFEERRIPNVSYRREVLTAQGIAVEQRPYYIFQRGVATVGVYMAQFGDDLYVSKVAFARGMLSQLRLAFAGFVVLFAIFGWFVLPFLAFVTARVQGSLFTGGVILFVLLLPVVLASGPVLLIGGAYALYCAVIQRDLLAVFRAPLNEFQIDDLIALEAAVKRVLLQAVDDVGIDQAALDATKDYAYRRRLI